MNISATVFPESFRTVLFTVQKAGMQLSLECKIFCKQQSPLRCLYQNHLEKMSSVPKLVISVDVFDAVRAINKNLCVMAPLSDSLDELDARLRLSNDEQDPSEPINGVIDLCDTLRVKYKKTTRAALSVFKMCYIHVANYITFDALHFPETKRKIVAGAVLVVGISIVCGINGCKSRHAMQNNLHSL